MIEINKSASKKYCDVCLIGLFSFIKWYSVKRNHMYTLDSY